MTAKQIALACLMFAACAGRNELDECSRTPEGSLATCDDQAECPIGEACDYTSHDNSTGVCKTSGTCSAVQACADGFECDLARGTCDFPACDLNDQSSCDGVCTSHGCFPEDPCDG